MRKIAANYICLPGFPLVKNGYVILEQGRVKDVVDTGGRIREIQDSKKEICFYPGWTRSIVGEEKSIREWEFGKVPVY